jgi:hypothetical protein
VYSISKPTNFILNVGSSLKPLFVLLEDAFHHRRIVGVYHIDLCGAMGGEFELPRRCFVVVGWGSVAGWAIANDARAAAEFLAWFHGKK